jgi:SAM-dependent methyltransferase
VGATDHREPWALHLVRRALRSLAREGVDLAGEARLVDAMLPRAAHVLDAGCGGGRVGGFLAAAGHRVVGVDLDPVLIDAARTDHPGPRWLVGDLASLDLPAEGDRRAVRRHRLRRERHDVPGTEQPVEVLRRFRRHLRPDGRAVVGFGAGRGYAVDDFFEDVGSAGLEVSVQLATWDLQPFTPDSDFVVAILSPGDQR